MSSLIFNESVPQLLVQFAVAIFLILNYDFGNWFLVLKPICALLQQLASDASRLSFDISQIYFAKSYRLGFPLYNLLRSSLQADCSALLRIQCLLGLLRKLTVKALCRVLRREPIVKFLRLWHLVVSLCVKIFLARYDRKRWYTIELVICARFCPSQL